MTCYNYLPSSSTIVTVASEIEPVWTSDGNDSSTKSRRKASLLSNIISLIIGIENETSVSLTGNVTVYILDS